MLLPNGVGGSFRSAVVVRNAFTSCRWATNVLLPFVMVVAIMPSASAQVQGS
jgi:hypothetical protein